jgi:hypothetical protein
MPAGVKYGVVVGVVSGLLWGLIWYPFVLLVTVPVYALAGALLGSLAAALVGASASAARSVMVGRLVGGCAGLALGLVLTAWACLAPATPPPFGPGRPINPAAGADEERALEKDYLRWLADQDRGERGALVVFLAVPATLCALASTWGPARRLRSLRPEQAGGLVDPSPSKPRRISR